MQFSLSLLCSLLLILSSCDNDAMKQRKDNIAAIADEKTKETSRLLRHVVLFNFNEEAQADTITKIEEAFAALPAQIPEIHSFEWGTNNSTEGLDKGLTHCFLLTFLSEADREIYLPHPAHKKFVELIGPYIEDVTVVDYWTK